MDINVAHQETGNDELERLALEECFKRRRHSNPTNVFITPAGHCELAIKFAHLGAQVDLADRSDYAQEIEGRILASNHRDQIHFIGKLLNEVDEPLPSEPYDIVFIRRGLCSLPYAEAKQRVRRMLQKLKIGGRIYISILGLHSELGDGYSAIDEPIAQRFGKLAPEMRNKYSIDKDVCLYTERDLFMLLLESGASVLRTMTTSYGSVKAVGGRT